MCRAQQRFRERQREKNKSVATQAVKLQQEVKDLRQKLAAATRPAAVVAPLPPAVVKSPEPETEVCFPGAGGAARPPGPPPSPITPTHHTKSRPCLS